MTIVIGLGNPGQKYTKTRHNIGFRVVDEFAKENNFPEFKFSKKYNSLLSENAFDNKKIRTFRRFAPQEPCFANEKIHNLKIILAKPQTFMNESGKAVKQLISNFKLQISNLIVIHDDIDLPLGEIKISKNRGSAGHKGVESIIKELKTKNFIRLRLGIKPDHSYPPTRRSGTKQIVLQKFTKEEQKIIDKTIDKTAEVLDFLIKNGLDKAMSKYNS